VATVSLKRRPLEGERWTAATRALARHGFPGLTIAFLVLTAWGSAIFVQPLELDNVVSLSFADRSNPFHFFTSPVTWTYPDTHGTVPVYRPLAYLSVWFQEQVGGLHAPQYFTLNLLIWIAAALALYAIVHTVTRSRLASLLAAGVFAIDDRVLTGIVWIGERQSTLAVMFGLLAFLVVCRWGETERRRWLAAGVGVLLLLSALSKEYGLAFLIAVPLYAALSRPRHWRWLAGAAVGALGVYLVLRYGVAGGANGAYCEDMGYFKHQRRVCYDALGTGAALKQHVWNVFATLVGTVFPQFFNGLGVLQRSGLRTFVVPVIVAALAAVGAIRKPRAALPLLSLVLANAALSFMLYRTRNQLIGMAGLYGAAGIGFWTVLAGARARLREWAAVTTLGALVVVFGWMAWHATRTDFPQVDSYRRLAAGIDPCLYLKQYPRNIRPDLVFRLKRQYNLSNPTCT
jgi:hypothetical protein